MNPEHRTEAEGGGSVRRVVRRILWSVKKYLTPRCQKQNQTKTIEEISEKGWLSIVSGDYATASSIWIGGHECRIRRMVDPLTNAEKKEAKKKEKCIGILYGVDLYGKRGNDPKNAKPNETLVPILHLKEGWEITHISPNDQAEARGAKTSDSPLVQR